MQNWSLKDDIRAYWTIRSETYDHSPGHGIATVSEMDAWRALITQHLGTGAAKTALDLACGTGVMTMLMHGLGFHVTGLDFTDAMMDRARAKARNAKAHIRFVSGDAEETMEPDDTYDVIIARHLVWTLENPSKAFADWHRILKPGGRILIIDGDFVRKPWLERLLPLLDRVFGKPSDGHTLLTHEQWLAHLSIIGRVHYNAGIRATDVTHMLKEAGFVAPLIDENLRSIRRARQIPFLSRKRLVATLQHRFACSAQKMAVDGREIGKIQPLNKTGNSNS